MKSLKTNTSTMYLSAALLSSTICLKLDDLLIELVTYSLHVSPSPK